MFGLVPTSHFRALLVCYSGRYSGTTDRQLLVFDNTGSTYNVSKVVNQASDYQVDDAAYQAYSPVCLRPRGNKVSSLTV